MKNNVATNNKWFYFQLMELLPRVKEQIPVKLNDKTLSSTEL